MLYLGQKINFHNREAVVLTYSDSEVLIYVDERYIKWVDKEDLLYMDHSA